eukprot:2549719-Amphidinium_carterae.1
MSYGSCSTPQPPITAPILFYLQSIHQQLCDASKKVHTSREHLQHSQQQQARSKNSRLLALQAYTPAPAAKPDHTTTTPHPPQHGFEIHAGMSDGSCSNTPQPPTATAILFYLQSIYQQLRDASKGTDTSRDHLQHNQQQQIRSRNSRLLALQIKQQNRTTLALVDRIYRQTEYGCRLYSAPSTTTTAATADITPASASPSITGGPPATPSTQSFATDTLAIRAITFNALSMSDDRGLADVGQLTHFATLMDKSQIDIATIQESRLNFTDPINLKNHHCYHVPACKGRGGLVTIIKKTNNTRIQSTFSPCTRLLMVSVLIHNVILHVINGHAPVRDSPQPQHDLFFEHYQHITSTIPHNEHLFCGIDLNARLAQLPDFDDIIGPFTTPRKGPTHIERLLLHCQRRRLYFVNTHLPPTTPQFQPIPADHPDIINILGTWRKPDKRAYQSVHQIDFVIATQITFANSTR